MFKAIRSSVYKFTSVFKIIGSKALRDLNYTAFFTMIFLINSHALSFELDSESLINQNDYFSKLEKSPKYKPLDELIRFCQDVSDKSEHCLKLAPIMYIDPQFVNFKDLVLELSIRFVLRGRRPLARLSFLNKDEITEVKLNSIIKKYDYADFEKFWGKDRLINSKKIKNILTENVSLLCKFRQQEDFVQVVLRELPLEKDFYQKDFSSFPCGLDLKTHLKELEFEIKKSKSSRKSARNYNYKFSFIENKFKNKAFQNFPWHKRRNLKYRKKRLWADLDKVDKDVQSRVARNLFYRGKYELLSSIVTVPKTRLLNLSEEVIEYAAKSLVARAEYEDVLSISEHVDSRAVKPVEEIFLMRGAVYLRQSKFLNAEIEFRKLLQNAVDLRLSALYWLRVSLKNQGKSSELKKIDAQILDEYPFSYYGLLVAQETKGSSFFNKYKKKVKVSANFESVLSSAEVEKMTFFYSYGHNLFFKLVHRDIEARLTATQRGLFSLVFYNQEDQREVIRSLNLIWDLNEGIRKEPFLSSSFPMPFKDEVKAATGSLAYTKSPLVYAVIRQESAFGVKARSGSGARGLMQLLPSTARDVARRIRKYRGYKKPGDLYKPKTNIYLGSIYMNRLIAAGKGYLPYAFASYNAGPGRMYRWSKNRTDITDLRQGFKKEEFNPIDELWIEELPWSETRFYTKALLRNMAIYTALNGPTEVFKCKPFWNCGKKNL